MSLVALDQHFFDDESSVKDVSTAEVNQAATPIEGATVSELRALLGDRLRTPEQVKAPEGLATGLGELDGFLFSHGLPKGALTLFSGALGTGATSLWIEAAARVIDSGKWVAWINHDVALSPLPLAQKGVNLDRFVSIQPDLSTGNDGRFGLGRAGHSVKDVRSPLEPKARVPQQDLDKRRSTHLFFILQELLSSSIFELVGCDLGPHQLKEHQLRKLQAQARDANVALVFISQNSNVSRLTADRRRSLFYRGSAASIFSLILQFEKKHLTVERALHRQTPHRVQRGLSYARFTNLVNTLSPELKSLEHARGRKPYSLP